jgi:cytochrome c oxidase assembly factor CtaG
MSTRTRVAPLVGLGVVGVALAPPMHALAESWLSAHMVQHLLLVLVAAPLLCLARLAPMLARLPPPARRWLGRRARVLRGARGPAIRVAVVPAAWLLHVATLWAWHAPALYEAALVSPALHALEHATLLGSALAFWAPVMRPAAHGGLGPGGAALHLAAAAGQCTVLGALMALASVPWYPAHTLADQHLAGLIMWMPAGLLYTAFALACLVPALRETPGPPAARDASART